MPLYEYECEQCGTRFEVIQRFSDPAVETCRTCGGPVHKLISPPAIHFKGTGWYITDYAKKNGSDASAGSSSSGSSSAASSSSSSSGSDAKSDSSSTTTTPASSSSDSAKKD